MRRLRPLLWLLLLALCVEVAHGQSYEAYRDTWEDRRRARFVTFRYDHDGPFSDAGYVSDRPREWSDALGIGGENVLVDPFEQRSEEGAKHVLLMVHGYGAPGANFLGGGYFESREDFFTESVAHGTGASAWYYDSNGPSLYEYLRESGATSGFDPDEWVILGVTLDISQGSGLSILANQRRLRALVDLLWHHKKEKILTLSFVSHSTGGPIVKGLLGGTDPEEHPWIEIVDDHLNLAGALGGTAFVYNDITGAFGAPDLRHQLTYGIQDPLDYDSGYKYYAGRTAVAGTYKRAYRWPDHVDVLSVAGVQTVTAADGHPLSGEIITTIPWDITDDTRSVYVYEGKNDGIVPSTSVIEHVQYKQIDQFAPDGDPYEWHHQLAPSDRYAIDYDEDWVLPSLQPPGTVAPLYGAGAGSLPSGSSSPADEVPASDRYPGEAVTYVEVVAQHNGLLHNEHLLRLVRRRLGTRTVEPNVRRPVVSELSQTSGPIAGGNTIEIYGSHFKHVTGIRFGDVYVGGVAPAGSPPSWSVDSESQITVPVPEGVSRLEGDEEPHVVDVRVINTAGTSEDSGVLDDYQYLYPLEAPSIDPPGGTFDAPAEVTLATEEAGAVIYYTLNGSEPGPDNQTSNVYATPVTVSASPGGDVTPITLRARSVKEGYVDSEVSEAVFSVDARVEAPTIFPDGGDFTGSVGITMGSETDGAKIYYTIDGGEPTYNSTKYADGFQLGVGEHTVRARAYQTGFNASPISESSFRVYATSEERTGDPILRPLGSGQFTDSVYVRMENHTEGAVIHYTLGQNEAPEVPTEESTSYAEPFSLKHDPSGPQDETTWYVRAKAFADGLPPSDMIQRSYAVSPALGETAAPRYEPSGGTFFNQTRVTVSSTTASARLYLTTDGSPATYDPDLPSEASPHTLDLDGHTELRSVAKRSFFSRSEETVAVYSFQTASPTVVGDPTTGTAGDGRSRVYLDSVRVSLGTETDGASIHYTLDGSEPQPSSTEYDGPFHLDETATVTARAFKSDYLHSEVASTTFSIRPSEAASVIEHPQSVETEEGTDVLFRVTAGGEPAPTYQWMHDRTEIRGATADSLLLKRVQEGDEGTYHVLVENAAGADRSQLATLSVVPGVVAPAITTAPSDRTAAVGAVVTFTATATGKPVPSFQWFKDDEPIPQATSRSLTLPAVSTNDEAAYRIVASNSAGTDTSRAATLTVIPAVAAAIVRSPDDVSVEPGDTARFSVEASGQPAPTYRWLRDGTPVPRETADTLSIPDVEFDDAGSYAVVVSNLAGIDTSEASVLTVSSNVAVEGGSEVVNRFALHPNYPNPFNPATTIAFDLPRGGDVTLTVYDLSGRRVAVLYEGTLSAGHHARRYDLSGLASGVYVYELHVDGPASDYHDVKGFVLLK